MRMWMVDPRIMCRKHLLGEHVEIHMLVGSLAKGRSIAGFLAKGLLEPQSVMARHAALAREMLRRGYRHKSPLIALSLIVPTGRVNRVKSASELAVRCSECRKAALSHQVAA